MKEYYHIKLKTHLTVPFDGELVNEIKIGSEEALVAPNQLGSLLVIHSKVNEGNTLFIPIDNIVYWELIPITEKVVLH